MNKFKQLCLLLCCSLVCLNGFFWESSLTAHAYTGDYVNTFPYVHLTGKGTLGVLNRDWVGNYYDSTYDSDNKITFSNPASNNVTFFSYYSNDNFIENFVYMPELYDYYFLSTVYGSATDSSQFTFVPDEITLHQFDCDCTVVDNRGYFLENLKVYHHDTNGFIGFTVFGKIPKTLSTAFSHITYLDSRFSRSIPANLTFNSVIVRVQRDTDVSGFTNLLSQIHNSIDNQGSSIQSAITETQKVLEDAIKNQFKMSEQENFGVEDIVDQVNEKAGVLSFGTDTLVNFLDLFDAANATNTKLTFPGFSMKIQGVDYQVWSDYHYDLSELENQFGALIEVVRWGCVMCVWLAVLNYLVKAYDTIFGR